MLKLQVCTSVDYNKVTPNYPLNAGDQIDHELVMIIETNSGNPKND